MTITEADVAIRLDAFLAKKSDDRSRGDIIRAIKAGNILVNGVVVKPHYKLHNEDVITITHVDAVQKQELVPNEDISLDIIDENDHFLVINKESGLQVHPSTRGETDTLANGLLAHYPAIKDVGDDLLRPGIMHRLDKDTSGLMVIAKDQEAYEVLKEAFKMRKVQKIYVALVWRGFDKKEGIIDAPIARAKSYTKQKVAHGKFGGDAKDATTLYSVTKEFIFESTKKSDASIISLVEVQPKTGRMHQIRVHFAHIQHPLVGDTKYCTKNEYYQNRHFFETLQTDDLHTFFLHASKLAFTLHEKEYKYELPLPRPFKTYIDSL